jgi:hypothetical protein
VRTAIWVLVATLLIATAVYGLEISLGHPARQGALADFEIQPGVVDHDGGEDHDDVGSPRYGR